MRVRALGGEDPLEEGMATWWVGVCTVLAEDEHFDLTARLEWERQDRPLNLEQVYPFQDSLTVAVVLPKHEALFVMSHAAEVPLNSTIFPQFSSVESLSPTLCDPMNRSTPGLPVHHQLLEFTQTHVH